MVLTIAAAIFVFGLLVLVHELGHFVTAKLTGMRVDEFAIGFGPKIVSQQYGETAYSIRAIPLGGFNDIAGMDPEDNDAGERGYCRKSIPRRMIVILAGSAMNLILPVFIFFGVFVATGVGEPNPDPVFGQVLSGHPAAEAGLQSGDRVIAVNGTPVTTWKEFTTALQQNVSEEETPAPVTLDFTRDGEQMTATMTPTIEKTNGRAVIGVMSDTITTYPGVIDCAVLAVQKTVGIIGMMLYELYQIILKLSGADLAGPIGVAQMAGQVAEMGFVPLLNFTAFLSLNLGIINLFPIPALDGGHFASLCIEGVKGSPLSPKTMYYAQRVGIALLLLLMIFATKNDIMRVFFGG
ncbi:RIP metalloprotease RseP [Selenomonas sp.]|uniref:RIP metalloprotease RseP n=1 Tax=Selenomonas sp. TaxID=2053611 RepID=UPI0025DA93BE|nr:RIP metalloprotease RseP [Selenomonas sp.]MCI6284808.1 RIP metalloprotease RseP [Selenomonas sp.]